MARRKNKRNDEPGSSHEHSAGDELNFAPDEKDAPNLAAISTGESVVFEFAPSDESVRIDAGDKSSRSGTAEGAAKRASKGGNGAGTNARSAKKGSGDGTETQYAKRGDSVKSGMKSQKDGAETKTSTLKIKRSLDSESTPDDPLIHADPYYVGCVKTPGFVARRANDLLLPALDPTTVRMFTMADYGLDKLIADVESKDYTGCIKVSLYQSRGCIVLFRGTVVGSVYTSKTNPMTLPTEHSLLMTMSALLVSEASVLMYKLPDSVILPSASLFIGNPVHVEQKGAAYVDHLRQSIANKRSTAVLALTIGGNRQTCLIFYHEGKFVGSFLVEKQLYSEDFPYTQRILQKEGIDNIEASVLNSPITGISMSQVRKRWRKNEPK